MDVKFSQVLGPRAVAITRVSHAGCYERPTLRAPTRDDFALYFFTSAFKIQMQINVTYLVSKKLLFQ